MEIQSTKGVLAECLAQVSGASESRKDLPIYAGVLLQATDNGSLAMTCADGSLTVKGSIGAEVRTAGACVVDARRLGDLLGTPLSADTPVTMKLGVAKGKHPSGVALEVRVARARYVLPTMPAADFPLPNQDQQKAVSITLPGRRFGALLEQICDCIPSNDVRSYLNGALIELDHEGLWLVASDGFRLFATHEPLKSEQEIPTRKIILPKRTVLLCRKLAAGAKSVRISLRDTEAVLRFGNKVVLHTRVLDGKFPPWRQAIPDTTDKIQLSSTVLIQNLALARAGLCSGAADKIEDRHRITLSLGQTCAFAREDQVNCEFNAIAAGDATHEIDVNVELLASASAVVAQCSEEIVIAHQEGKALKLLPANASYPVCVVMPMRR